MMKKNIAILFGGCSSEYEVSLESAYAVICNLDREKYAAVPIGITKEGEWFYYKGAAAKIKDDSWKNEAECLPAVLSPNRGSHQLNVIGKTECRTIPIHAAFPVLHGRNGEDGTVQGLITLAGIPLVGCGVLASALCMDKERAHRLAATQGIRVPRSFTATASVQEEELMESARRIGYPLFVKPVKAGSSYGVTRVEREEELADAVRQAFFYDDEIIVEENIQGFEVGCAIMGREKLTVGEVDEIELSGGFFDFTEKYTLQTSAIHVPARIEKETAKRVKKAAEKIYRVLGCSGFARVDMFLTPEHEIVFNEVNTIPGFTEHSRFPGMMKAAGISFSEILTEVIEGAV